MFLSKHLVQNAGKKRSVKRTQSSQVHTKRTPQVMGLPGAFVEADAGLRRRRGPQSHQDSRVGEGTSESLRAHLPEPGFGQRGANGKEVTLATSLPPINADSE
jgi:hypothetical protein